MDKLFLNVINMSLTGAFVIAMVMLVRLPLKKAPKIISYCLWAVVGFRLICPFTIDGLFSLIPFNTQPIPSDIGMQAIPRIDSGIRIIDNAVSASLPPASTVASVNLMLIWTAIGAYAWFIGAAVMALYGIISYILLKRRMRTAIRVDGNIYEADTILSPFVLGIIKPKIYLPLSLADGEREYIILHERTHIRRRDHIVKFGAYFILCLHWFNPLAWAAFLLMGVDMEMSCDERVLKEVGGETKHDYSRSLLSLATQRRIIGGSPLAFGEGGVKGRVKNILNFRKPSRVIIVAAITLVAVLSVGFAVNRAAETASRPLNMSDVQKMHGKHYEEVHKYLGEPNGQLSGMWGEIYDLADGRYAIVYYSNNGFVDNIIAHYQETDELTNAHPDTMGTESVKSEAMELLSEMRNYSDNMQMQYGYFENEHSTITYPSILIDDVLFDQIFSLFAEYEWRANRALSSFSASDFELFIEIYTRDMERVITLYGGYDLVFYQDAANGIPMYYTYIPSENAATVDLAKRLKSIIDGNIGTAAKSDSLKETPPDDMSELIRRVENSLSIIMSSPRTSSNPQDYINAHDEEYQNLAFKYPDGVLEYLLSEFETGNSDGLRGHIMMRICKDILGLSNNITDESLSPQEWYNQLSVISQTWLPDFEPDNPEGEYGGLVYSAITQHYSQLDYSFLVSAPTVYGAYEEDGKLKIIMTVFYQRYRLFGKKLESTGGGVIPGAAVFKKDDSSGAWVFEEYLEVGTAGMPDGMYFNDSIQKLCVMPVSGREIEGLAKTIVDDYVNEARQELLSQNLIKHLLIHGQTGVSLRTPGGELIDLT